jgi:hypothetical protein
MRIFPVLRRAWKFWKNKVLRQQSSVGKKINSGKEDPDEKCSV